MRRLPALVFAFALVGGAAYAHIMVSPPESKAGATQNYELRVHNEAKIATTSLELEIPEGNRPRCRDAGHRHLHDGQDRRPDHGRHLDDRRAVEQIRGPEVLREESSGCERRALECAAAHGGWFRHRMER